MELINQILAEIYTYLGRKPQTTNVLFQEYDSTAHSVLYQLIDGDNYILIGILAQDPDPEYAYATIAAWGKLNDVILQQENGTHGTEIGKSIDLNDPFDTEHMVRDLIRCYTDNDRNNPITWLKEQMT